MFQSVIARPRLRSGYLGTGLWTSLVVHAGLLAGALALSARGEGEPKAPDRPVVFFHPRAPAPPRGQSGPAPAPAQARPSKPRERLPRRLVLPTPVPPEAVPPPPAPDLENTAPPEELPVVPGGHPDGVEVGGVPGAPIVGAEIGGGGGEEVLAFGDGMTPPQLLSTSVLQYTREALEARVRGTLIAKCVITREGRLEECRIIKGLPHMNEAVLSALATRRYRPVYFQGQPVSVSYVFNIKLELPE